MQRRLTIVTLLCYLLFTLIVVWKMIFSALKLG
jgi:predicted nucleic acid-binding Zn ribbon protein